MSNFRQRAAAVKAAGEKRRGEWQPTGKVKASYDYWLANSESMYAFDVAHGTKKENFCHFWRVVLFWSPMLRLSKILGPHSDAIGMGIAAFFVMFMVGTFIAEFGLLTVLGLIGAVLAASLAVFWLAFAGAALTTKFSQKYPELSKKIRRGLTVLLVVAGCTLFTLSMGSVHIALGVFVGAGIILLALAIWKVDEIGTMIEGRRALREEEFEPEAAKEVEPRQPGKIATFVKNFGDFIVLIAQVVRVSKWKICPIVELEKR